LTVLVNSDVNAAFIFLNVDRFGSQVALSAFNILASGSQADKDILARLVLALYQVDPVAANSFVLEQYRLNFESISASMVAACEFGLVLVQFTHSVYRLFFFLNL